MPKDDKSKYADKQKRQEKRTEDAYKEHCLL